MNEEEKKEIENMINDKAFWEIGITNYINRTKYLKLIKNMYEELFKE